MRFNDAISGLAIVAFAAFGLIMVSRFPEYPGERFGPGLFPGITLAVMLLCGALLVWRGAAQWRAAPALTLAPWAREGRNFLTLAAIAGAVLVYIAFGQRLGFPVAGFIVCFGLLLWMRGLRLWMRSALVSAAAVLFIYVLFARVLRVPLPLGFVSSLIY